MTGFSLDIVDITRLRYYTFFSPDGLVLHQAGISALSRFLNARLNLYTNVYYHRTTRALDLHLQEIFRDTMNLVYPFNPADNLDAYQYCDEWHLFQAVGQWLRAGDKNKSRLARQWDKLHKREIKWKMSYSTELSIDEVRRGTGFSGAQDNENQIRKFLPQEWKRLQFKVDLATQDPRPLNPMVEGEKRINIYDPPRAPFHRNP